KSKKTSAKTSSIQYASSSPAEGSQVGAVASPGGFASSGMLPWLLGLGGIVALGVAGVFLLPLQAQGAKETRGQAEEFEIVDN
ncbi:hypothetical protein H7X87_02675, partial [Acetobacteraceae bacterium]|nr:hypothetical protein [Candidatus Parcubacteria bacterium]